jgi:Arc/MetJ family transcription regulator
MRTNVVLDDELVNEAIRLSGAKTKKEVISFALREFVATRKRRNLLDIEGKIKFREAYDHKEMRKDR